MNILKYTHWTNILCAALLLKASHMEYVNNQSVDSIGWAIFACMYATMDGYGTRDQFTVFRATAGTLGVMACVLLIGNIS